MGLGDGFDPTTGVIAGSIILNPILPSTAKKPHNDQDIPANNVEPSPDTHGQVEASQDSTLTEPIRPYLRKSKIQTLVAESEYVGSVKYEMSYVTNYQELKKALKVEHSISALIGVVGSASVAATFADSINLTDRNTTFIFSGTCLHYINRIPKNPHLALKEQLLKLLETNPIAFSDAVGSEIISEIGYGAVFFAEVTFLNTSAEKAQKYQLDLQAGIAQVLSGPKLSVSSHSAFYKNEQFSKTNVQIKVTAVGAPEVRPPSIGGDLEDFARFLVEFNEHVGNSIGKGQAIYPITYKTTPYVHLLETPAASKMQLSMVLTRDLLLAFDALISRLRFVIPSIDELVKLVDNANIPQGNQLKVERLYKLHRDANDNLTTIRAIMAKLDASKADLGAFRLLGADKIDMLRSPSRASVSCLNPELEMSAHLQSLDRDNAFNKSDKLREMIGSFSRAVSSLESDLKNTTISLKAEVGSILFQSKTSFFKKKYLNLAPFFFIKAPVSNPLLEWDVLKNGKPLEGSSPRFDVKRKKYGEYHYHKYSKDDALLTELRHGAQTTLSGLNQRDKFKITRIYNEDGSAYTQSVTISVKICGAPALQVHNGSQALTNISDTPPSPREQTVGLYVDQADATILTSPVSPLNQFDRIRTESSDVMIEVYTPNDTTPRAVVSFAPASAENNTGRIAIAEVLDTLEITPAADVDLERSTISQRNSYAAESDALEPEDATAQLQSPEVKALKQITPGFFRAPRSSRVEGINPNAGAIGVHLDNSLNVSNV